MSGGESGYRVWIDQDLCTGDGICAELAPDVFHMQDDGLAYVKEAGARGLDAAGKPTHAGALGTVAIPLGVFEPVIESAEECPGDCIFIEPAA